MQGYAAALQWLEYTSGGSSLPIGRELAATMEPASAPTVSDQALPGDSGGLPLADRVVLVSPFTSISDMAEHLFSVHFPLSSWLLSHNFDNKLALAATIQRYRLADAPLSLTVVHGEEDEIVPSFMGTRWLAPRRS